MSKHERNKGAHLVPNMHVLPGGKTEATLAGILGQCLPGGHGAIEEVSYCPDLPGPWNVPHALQDIHVCPPARAAYHSPLRAIPLFGQRLARGCPVVIISHGPDVFRGHDRHAQERIAEGATVWASDQAPLRSIPVLDHRAIDAGIATARRVSHGPDVFGRNLRHAMQHIEATRRAWAGNDCPGFPVPVEDQRQVMRGFEADEVIAHRPGIGR